MRPQQLEQRVEGGHQHAGLCTATAACLSSPASHVSSSAAYVGIWERRLLPTPDTQNLFNRRRHIIMTFTPRRISRPTPLAVTRAASRDRSLSHSTAPHLTDPLPGRSDWLQSSSSPNAPEMLTKLFGRHLCRLPCRRRSCWIWRLPAALRRPRHRRPPAGALAAGMPLPATAGGLEAPRRPSPHLQPQPPRRAPPRRCRCLRTLSSAVNQGKCS